MGPSIESQTLTTHPFVGFSTLSWVPVAIKSFVIAIKLAQFEYTRNIKGFKPILLLDDVFDKLDDLRVAQLIRLVSENSFGQVFITDTSRERIIAMFNSMEIEHKIFNLPLAAGD